MVEHKNTNKMDSTLLGNETKRVNTLHQNTLMATNDILTKANIYLNAKEMKDFKRNLEKNLDSISICIKSMKDPAFSDICGQVDFEKNILGVREDHIDNIYTIRHELYHLYTADREGHIDAQTGERVNNFGFAISTKKNGKLTNTRLADGMIEYLNDGDTYDYEKRFARILHFCMGDDFIKSFLKHQPDKVQSEFDSKAGKGAFELLNKNLDSHNSIQLVEPGDKKYVIEATSKEIQSCKIVASYFYNFEKNSINSGEYLGAKGINNISKRIAGFENLLKGIVGYDEIKEEFDECKNHLNSMLIEKVLGKSQDDIQKDKHLEAITKMQNQLVETFKSDEQSFYYTQDSKKFLLDERYTTINALKENSIDNKPKTFSIFNYIKQGKEISR